jgi:hypothetical protein
MISPAANMLQKAGLISYRYGKMVVLDPKGWAAGSCECSRLMEHEFAKVTGQDGHHFEREQTDRGLELA